MSPKAQQIHYLNELKYIISLALKHKDMRVEDGSSRKFLDSCDIRDLKGAAYSLRTKVKDIIMPLLESFGGMLFWKNDPHVKVKHCLLNCIEMGFKPKLYHLSKLNLKHDETLDIIRICIECDVQILKKNDEGKLILDLLREERPLDIALIKELEDLALFKKAVHFHKTYDDELTFDLDKLRGKMKALNFYG